MTQLLTGFEKHQFTCSFISSTVIKIHRYTNSSRIDFIKGRVCLIALSAVVCTDILNDAGSKLRRYMVAYIHVTGLT